MYGALDSNTGGSKLLHVSPWNSMEWKDARSRRAAPEARQVPVGLINAFQDWTWQASASGTILQLLLWAGSWGLVDALVSRASGDDPEERFSIYAIISLAGAVTAPPLLRAQTQPPQAREQEREWEREQAHAWQGWGVAAGPDTRSQGSQGSQESQGSQGSQASQPFSGVAGSALCFAIGLSLCSGLWGMVDSTVDAMSGEQVDMEIASYGVLTTLAALGVALHHALWPHQVLDNLGQVSLV